jgi:hypothetical protein
MPSATKVTEPRVPKARVGETEIFPRAVMPRSTNFHRHLNTRHPERSEGSAFHEVRPQSLAKKILARTLEGGGFIPALTPAQHAGASAPESGFAAAPFVRARLQPCQTAQLSRMALAAEVRLSLTSIAASPGNHDLSHPIELPLPLRGSELQLRQKNTARSAHLSRGLFAGAFVTSKHHAHAQATTPPIP